MPNCLQKFIYNASLASPLLLSIALVWCFHEKTYFVPILCGGIAALLVGTMLVSFLYAKKHLAPIKIQVANISPYDGWIPMCTICYILPFFAIMKENGIVGPLILGVIFVFMALYVNTPAPNIILACMKYHFYSANTENGITGYLVISKRKLRKKQDLALVKRIFEFLLLDIEEKSNV